MNITELLEQRAFSIVFQPIVRLANRRVWGYEALTRFADEPSPLARFAEAKAAGLQSALELATLRAALLEARKLPVRAVLFLNISPSVLMAKADALGEALAGTKRAVILEISEGEELPEPEQLLAALARHCPGVRLALDDVGAGYADSARIFALSPAFVKLDRELVNGMAFDGPRRAEAEQILLAAASQEAEVVAEGLESESEVLRLTALGVAYGQGWVLGRPASAASWSKRPHGKRRTRANDSRVTRHAPLAGANSRTTLPH